MTRMGHDSERAALIYQLYQHQARGADKRITDAIDLHVLAALGQDDDDDGQARSARLANCTFWGIQLAGAAPPRLAARRPARLPPARLAARRPGSQPARTTGTTHTSRTTGPSAGQEPTGPLWR
jgi:hypothetical protein